MKSPRPPAAESPAAPAPRPPLAVAVRDAGFTPRARDLDALVDLLLDDELTRDADRAIGRLGPRALERLATRFEAATPPLRARVLRAVGRYPLEGRARELLLAALQDDDPKTRRNAALALGHAQGSEVEEALLAAWERDPRPEMRRTLAASLGKIGGPRAAELLAPAARSDDPRLSSIASRAVMMVDRTASRADRGRLDASRAPVLPVDVALPCRRGLEELLAEELAPLERQGAVADARVAGAGCVRARLVGPLEALFAARTMLGISFPLATEWVRDGDSLEEAVARAITGDAARALYAAWTVGAVRYRIAWAGGAHRRAATWNVAQTVARRAPELVNDPTASLWEITVTPQRRFVEVSLAPRGLADPRFAWRAGDVPAASHPTIAAALARVAGVRPDDVVWDPFVGSGGELVERALLGPARELRGSDQDPRALEVARANLASAHVTASLEQGDALSLAPRGVTLILTNPPMGRRASRAPGLDATLDRFVAHAATVLVPGGRLVWLAPWPQRARAAAAAAGLRLDWARVVDMGGFDAELQRLLR